MDKDLRMQEFGGEIRRSDVKMIEFDWIFQGREGFLFIEELATTDNESIFEVESIKISIEYLWGFYFNKIFKLVFCPK